MANTKRSLLVDAGFRHLTRLFAFFVFILLAGILASLVYGSRDSLAEYGLPFLWTNDWDPVRQVDTTAVRTPLPSGSRMHWAGRR